MGKRSNRWWRRSRYCAYWKFFRIAPMLAIWCQEIGDTRSGVNPKTGQIGRYGLDRARAIGGWSMARHRSFGSEFKRQIANEFIDGRTAWMSWRAGTVYRVIGFGLESASTMLASSPMIWPRQRTSPSMSA
jgi:hypothetical protein